MKRVPCKAVCWMRKNEFGGMFGVPEESCIFAGFAITEEEIVKIITSVSNDGRAAKICDTELIEEDGELYHIIESSRCSAKLFTSCKEAVSSLRARKEGFILQLTEEQDSIKVGSIVKVELGKHLKTA